MTVYLFYSISEHLKKELDDYISKNFTNVRIVRSDTRLGLIRARMLGADQATGKVRRHAFQVCKKSGLFINPARKQYTIWLIFFIDHVMVRKKVMSKEWYLIKNQSILNVKKR